ncbi:Mu transposase C-terminal domain-containing protein [Alicyclobacillus fastidiosus]|uniref:DDE-type integrase/transposase/recombinase n=1 Tax=Alicyclobacillus fastidiosus TaxID=392011 RepID=A0ABV5AJ01_9BACL|nr:Mu transposase C-terminal domain-containing protein [Alicyclobacillus fastidiosus]WEH10037.1 DDE-type integrase/transposase/recombinase [Alicyclobacillus fastidiosus]
MVINQLKVNSELVFYGKIYKVLSIDPPNVSLLRSEGNGEVVTVPFTDLVGHLSFRPGKSMMREIARDEAHYQAVLDALTDKQREEVSRRFEMIKPLVVFDRLREGDLRAVYEFMSHYKGFLLENETLDDLTQIHLLERISQKYAVPDEYGIVPKGTSVRSLKRYLSAYRKAETELDKRGEEGLLAKQGDGYLYRQDNRTIEICHPKKPDVVLCHINVRIGEQYISIIKEAVEKEYLTLKRKTKKAVYQSILIRCAKEKLEPPKEDTIVKMLGRIPSDVRVRLRDGNKAAEGYDPVTRGFSNEEAQYPLHIVEIDHTELDLDVIDEKTGYVIGRPWITLGIDVFSRMVWCLYVSFEPPSANVVRKALEQGIFLKKAREKYGTDNEWDVFGIPSIIYMDNGSEFRNEAVKRMITETLKSNVRYRPVKTPRYGGTIERLFGTLNKQLIHQLDGTRKSSLADLGEYDPNKEAVLSLEDVRAAITKYIVDIYHMSPHKGLPLDADTPIVRYLDGIRKVGYPNFVTAEQESAYRLELLPVKYKPYTRDGVRLNNVLYKLNRLAYLIEKQSTKYKVKYDIDDISKIYIQPPGSDEYVRVPAVQPASEELVDVNWYTWKELRKIMRAESNEKRAAVPGTKHVVEAKAKLRAFIRDKYKSGRKARQQAVRMNVPVSLGGPLEAKSTHRQPTVRDLLAAAKQAAKERKSEGAYE